MQNETTDQNIPKLIMAQNSTYRTAFYNRNDEILYPPEMVHNSLSSPKTWYDFLGTLSIKNQPALNTLNNLSFQKQDLSQERNYFIQPTTPQEEKSGFSIWPIILLIVAALGISLLLALFINNFAQTQLEKNSSADNTEISASSGDTSSKDQNDQTANSLSETGQTAATKTDVTTSPSNSSSASNVSSSSSSTSGSEVSNDTNNNGTSTTGSNSSGISTHSGHADGLIMVGAFTEQSNVDSVIKKLESQGYDVYTRNPDEWMTYIGVYANHGDTETLNWIRTNIASDAWFTK